MKKLTRSFLVNHLEITINYATGYIEIYDAAIWSNPPLAITVEQLREILLQVEDNPLWPGKMK